MAFLNHPVHMRMLGGMGDQTSNTRLGTLPHLTTTLAFAPLVQQV